ncbi:MAG: Ig-like domain-containing protein, partial [Phycisphaerae bacterium]
MRTWNLTSLLGRIVGGVALVCAGSTAMADSISANGTITNVSADTGLAPGSFVLSAAAPVLTIPSGDFGGSGYRAGGTPSVLEFRVAPGFRFNAAALPILTPDDPELTFGAPVFVNDGLVTVTVTGVPNPATDVNVTITNFDVGIDPGSPNAVAVANAASGLFPVELSRPFLAGPPPALVLFQLDTVAGIIPTDNSTLTAGAGDLVALANSADPIRVVFTARDFGNNLIPNTNLAVDILSNNAGLAPLPAQITVNPAVGARVTNGSGQIDFVLTASSAVPTTALAAQFPLSAVSGPSISFTAVPVLDISILGSGTAVANNTDSVVVQVRARDAGNISLPNLPVTLLLDTLAALSTINVNGAAAPIVTNANGLATFSLTSDVAAAAFSVTAQTPSPTEADPALVADSPDAGPIQFTAASLGFVVTSVTPSPLVSGAPFTLNFSIRDEGGTGELTAVTGANLDIAVKGGNGQLIGNCVGCTGFNGSSGSITGFAYVTDVVPESNVQIAIVSTNQSIGSASSANLTVNPAAGRSLQFDTQP